MNAVIYARYSSDSQREESIEQLKECEKGIENMLNAIQAGVLTPSTKERLDQLEARRSDLNISIMQAELTRPKYTKQQIVEWISQFKHGDPNDLNYQKQIIDIFLNSIYVYDDRYVFTYNFHGGTETIPREAVEEAFGSDLTRLAPPEALQIEGTEKGALFIKRSTSFSIVLYNLAFHYSGIIGSPIRKEKMTLSDG